MPDNVKSKPDKRTAHSVARETSDPILKAKKLAGKDTNYQRFCSQC